MLAQRMAEKHTQLRLCPRAAAIIPGTPAGPDDFDTEFLDYILAVRVVGSLEEAVAHIAAHSTGHSEAIITGDEAAAQAFCTAVDSARRVCERLPPALQTAVSSALAAKWAFPPKSWVPAGPWACPSSQATNTSSAAQGRRASAPREGETNPWQ